MAPETLATNLRDVLDRSTKLSDPAAIQVAVQPDGVVVLRGTAKDEDEVRLAENMLRLTPGIRGVRNEVQSR